MPVVVGIRFKPAGKIYHFDADEFELSVGDAVIVETIRGIEFGEVVVGRRAVPEDSLVQPLKKVIRCASAQDHEILNENRQKEKEAFGICVGKIEQHNLPMNPIDVEYTFDRGKIIFYFTAEGRVDFRELVRDLASIFKTRIELRQIGVRDEAKMLGGVGSCGRVLCCCTFLGDFEPVSIRMAKDQNLSLNPTKISGICGRLMCCLKFESEQYESGDKDRRRRDPDPEKNRDPDRGREQEKNRDQDRNKEQERPKDQDRNKNQNRGKDQERGKERDQTRNKDLEKRKDLPRDKEATREKDQNRDRNQNREADSAKKRDQEMEAVSEVRAEEQPPTVKEESQQ